MRADASAGAHKLDSDFRKASPLTCRFALMLRCDDPACRRANVISPGQDIRSLQSSRFFCWMNPQADSSQSQCPHVPEAGEAWIPQLQGSARKHKASRIVRLTREKRGGQNIGKSLSPVVRGSSKKAVAGRKPISGPW